MPQHPGAKRTFKNDRLLATGSAFTAGMTNVAGVMACFSFTANVTGHTAAFAKHMLNGNWFEILVVFSWIFLFLLGAGIAHFLIRSFEYRGHYFAHAIPIAIELIVLCGIGFYGSYFHEETITETQIITGSLLFAMGIQNSAVATTTTNGIKTSHLTGLFTDLGAELAEWLHPKTARPKTLKEKLSLRIAIVLFYLAGGIAGGLFFEKFDFGAFYLIAVTTGLILLYDIFHLKKQNEKED